MDTLYATFSDAGLAQRATGALLDHGIRKEHLSLIAHIPHQGVVGPEDHPDPVEQAKSGLSTTTGGDAAAGAARGAGVGLGLGALAALVSLFIPGFGLVTGGGALATALMAGAGTTLAGAAAGGVTGFLVDQGVPKEVAQDYQKALKRGGAIIAVSLVPGEALAPTQDILNKYGVERISLIPGQPAGRIR